MAYKQTTLQLHHNPVVKTFQLKRFKRLLKVQIKNTLKSMFHDVC